MDERDTICRGNETSGKKDEEVQIKNEGEFG